MLKRAGFTTPAEFITKVVLPIYKERKINVVIHDYSEYIVFDWINYLTTYIFDGLKNHSRYRAFRFERQGEDVVFWVKENSLSLHWIGFNGSSTFVMYNIKVPERSGTLILSLLIS